MGSRERQVHRGVGKLSMLVATPHNSFRRATSSCCLLLGPNDWAHTCPTSMLPGPTLLVDAADESTSARKMMTKKGPQRSQSLSDD